MHNWANYMGTKMKMKSREEQQWVSSGVILGTALCDSP